jgi:hypothetical protein
MSVSAARTGRNSILTRIERLESLFEPVVPVYFRYGFVKPLPGDYAGPRHVVVVKKTPATSPFVEWCEFEERVGVSDSNDRDFTVLLESEDPR